MNALVIEPGHGSTWMTDAVFVDRFGRVNPRGRFVQGFVWDEPGWNMPDDYQGMDIIMTYPRRFILKVETSIYDTPKAEA